MSSGDRQNPIWFAFWDSITSCSASGTGRESNKVTMAQQISGNLFSAIVAFFVVAATKKKHSLTSWNTPNQSPAKERNRSIRSQVCAIRIKASQLRGAAARSISSKSLTLIKPDFARSLACSLAWILLFAFLRGTYLTLRRKRWMVRSTQKKDSRKCTYTTSSERAKRTTDESVSTVVHKLCAAY